MPASTRGPLRENAHAEEPHSSIQVEPITRPSLRDGWTAYAVLSREPSSFWPPSPSRNSPTPRRLTRCRIRKSLTVATTARTTRFCRTHGSPFRRSIPGLVDGAGNLQTRRSLAAPLVGTKPRAHGEQSALPLASRTRTLPRPPQARLANVTTTRSPLKDEPGWATHTPKPNFGKAEYIYRRGLTHPRHRSRNETPPAEATRGGAKHRPFGANRD